jgi:hypothetical protein
LAYLWRNGIIPFQAWQTKYMSGLQKSMGYLDFQGKSLNSLWWYVIFISIRGAADRRLARLIDYKVAVSFGRWRLFLCFMVIFASDGVSETEASHA